MVEIRNAQKILFGNLQGADRLGVAGVKVKVKGNVHRRTGHKDPKGE
jgi:hypothetical protein